MRRLPAICAMVAVAAAGTSSVAETLTMSSKARVQLFEKQLKVLDGRAAQQYSNSVRLLPDYSGMERLSVRVQRGERHPGPYLELARSAATRHGVPEQLFVRLVRQESGWNPKAVSPKGAIGLAQVMPETARYLKIDPHSPRANLEGGARYLSEQYRRFGSWRLALAAYNAGPEAVERYGGVPPYRETQGYVRAILGQ